MLSRVIPAGKSGGGRRVLCRRVWLLRTENDLLCVGRRRGRDGGQWPRLFSLCWDHHAGSAVCRRRGKPVSRFARSSRSCCTVSGRTAARCRSRSARPGWQTAVPWTAPSWLQQARATTSCQPAAARRSPRDPTRSPTCCTVMSATPVFDVCRTPPPAPGRVGGPAPASVIADRAGLVCLSTSTKVAGTWAKSRVPVCGAVHRVAHIRRRASRWSLGSARTRPLAGSDWHAGPHMCLLDAKSLATQPAQATTTRPNSSMCRGADMDGLAKDNGCLSDFRWASSSASNHCYRIASSSTRQRPAAAASFAMSADVRPDQTRHRGNVPFQLQPSFSGRRARHSTSRWVRAARHGFRMPGRRAR